MEDSTSHFMIRWQFSDASAKALVGKAHDRTGAATALVEGFGGKLQVTISPSANTMVLLSANSPIIQPLSPVQWRRLRRVRPLRGNDASDC